jgi:hypothetical protein
MPEGIRAQPGTLIGVWTSAKQGVGFRELFAYELRRTRRGNPAQPDRRVRRHELVSVKLVSKSPKSVARSLIIMLFCRTFLSGGTRIRTGDTMIFSRRHYVLTRTTPSTKLADLRGLSGSIGEDLSITYRRVSARLQYGCSTSAVLSAHRGRGRRRRPKGALGARGRRLPGPSGACHRR